MIKDKQRKVLKSALPLIAALTILIFLTETIIMFFLEGLFVLPILWRIILDPVLLCLLIFPFFYFLVYKPFRHKIIELERITEALRKSSKELADYKYALDESSIVSMTDRKGIINYVNDNFCSISQYDRSELMGKHHRILNSGYHSDDFFRNLWETIESGKTWRGEIKNKAKDGTFNWQDTAIIPFVNDQDVSVQFIAVRGDITARKEAEVALIKLNDELEQRVTERTEAMEKSELRYSSLFKNMIEGVAHCKMLYENGKPVNFIYLDVNAAFENLTGLKNVVGKKVTEIIPGIKEDNPELFATYSRVALTGKPERFEVYLSSMEMWFYISVFSSEKEYFTVVFDVITERKIIEEKIHASELRYRRLFEAAKDGILILNADTGVIEDVNPFMVEMLGYSRDEFFGKHLWEIGLFKDIIANKDSFLKLKEERYIRYENLPLKTKNGHAIWVEFVSNVYGVNGKSVIQCNIRNITERKEADENLKQSELRFQEFFENSPVALSVFDLASLKFVSNNISAVKLFRFSDKELQTKGPNDISPEFQPDGRSSEEKAKEFLLKTLNGEKPDFEWVYCDGDGNEILCETRFALLSSVGAPLILASTLNITDRKSSEKKLNEQNKELLKTNSELDHFVYSTSHDLRSPLTSVLGLIGFIEDETKEPDTLEHAHMIRARVKRLDDFVTNILNYSRNNRLDISPVHINFYEIIRQTVDGLKHVHEAIKIHFEINVDAFTPFYSDLQRITAIFENLIGNAIKYYDLQQKKPFVSIHVITTPHQADITIEDNGIGIAIEHQAKIFDMFYRVSGAAPGSGLGLYLVKEIIDKLEGTIIIQSVIGSGTKFLITLKNINYGKNN